MRASTSGPQKIFLSSIQIFDFSLIFNYISIANLRGHRSRRALFRLTYNLGTLLRGYLRLFFFNLTISGVLVRILDFLFFYLRVAARFFPILRTIFFQLSDLQKLLKDYLLRPALSFLIRWFQSTIKLYCFLYFSFTSWSGNIAFFCQLVTFLTIFFVSLRSKLIYFLAY